MNRCTNTFFRASITCTSSSSASFHRTPPLYVNARLAMLGSVEGCSASKHFRLRPHQLHEQLFRHLLSLLIPKRPRQLFHACQRIWMLSAHRPRFLYIDASSAMLVSVWMLRAKHPLESLEFW